MERGGGGEGEGARKTTYAFLKGNAVVLAPVGLLVLGAGGSAAQLAVAGIVAGKVEKKIISQSAVSISTGRERGRGGGETKKEREGEQKFKGLDILVIAAPAAVLENALCAVALPQRRILVLGETGVWRREGGREGGLNGQLP